MVVVENFKAFAQDAVFPDFYFCQAGNRGTCNVGVFADGKNCTVFHGNKIMMADSDMVLQLEDGFRRNIKSIVRAQFKTIWNCAFRVLFQKRPIVFAEGKVF